MDPDRLVDKFADLNEHVAKEQHLGKIRERLDRMVLGGKLGYDPETSEYIRFSKNDGLFGSVAGAED